MLLGRDTRRHGGKFRKALIGLPLILCLPAMLSFAQSPSSRNEISTTDSEPKYKLRVERNLVQVRVVVRDDKGETVSDLKKEDFLLYDSGKLQTISHFSVEKAPATKPQPAGIPPKSAEPDAAREAELESASPHRYLALYFDDIRMPFEDVSLIRKAAEEFLRSSLTPGDRVGIYTSSGLGDLDFTADRDALQAGLLRLQPRPSELNEHRPCPEILDYQAYLMTNADDPIAKDVATQEDLYCQYMGDPRYLNQAQANADSEAVRQLEKYQTFSEESLRGLDELIRRLSIVPGQRSIILVSTGFLTMGMENRVDQVVDHALRENVIVSTLDSRALDASTPGLGVDEQHTLIPDRPDINGRKLQFRLDERWREKEILAALASGTGGLYFHDNNDLQEGLRLTSGFPGVYYTLAFSPEKMKFDGRFHRLDVKLVGRKSLTVEARRGYFAPRQSAKPEDRAKEEIASALFSQDALSQIPVEVQTQFFKQDQLDATLSILARVDLRYLQFRKEEGRNLNNLTVVTALFDENGNYLQGKERKVDFRLRDSSLEQLAQTGLTMRTSFSVKPGTYMIREVVRDSEGSQMSGLTRTVEIPY